MEDVVPQDELPAGAAAAPRHWLQLFSRGSWNNSRNNKGQPKQFKSRVETRGMVEVESEVGV